MRNAKEEEKHIDRLLSERAADLENMHEANYKYLVDSTGLFTIRQLVRVLEEGRADHLRDVARDELKARSAATPTWITWLSIAAIAVGLLASILQVADWLRERS